MESDGPGAVSSSTATSASSSIIATSCSASVRSIECSGTNFGFGDIDGAGGVAAAAAAPVATAPSMALFSPALDPLQHHPQTIFPGPPWCRRRAADGGAPFMSALSTHLPHFLAAASAAADDHDFVVSHATSTVHDSAPDALIAAPHGHSAAWGGGGGGGGFSATTPVLDPYGDFEGSAALSRRVSIEERQVMSEPTTPKGSTHLLQPPLSAAGAADTPSWLSGQQASAGGMPSSGNPGRAGLMGQAQLPAWTQLKTKAGKQRRRLPLACYACRQKKVRCSGETPTCKHCLRWRIPCVYKTRSQKATPRRGSKATSDEAAQAAESSSTVDTTTESGGGAACEPDDHIKLEPGLVPTSPVSRADISRKRSTEDSRASDPEPLPKRRASYAFEAAGSLTAPQSRAESRRCSVQDEDQRSQTTAPTSIDTQRHPSSASFEGPLELLNQQSVPLLTGPDLGAPSGQANTDMASLRNPPTLPSNAGNVGPVFILALCTVPGQGEGPTGSVTPQTHQPQQQTQQTQQTQRQQSELDSAAGSGTVQQQGYDGARPSQPAIQIFHPPMMLPPQATPLHVFPGFGHGPLGENDGGGGGGGGGGRALAVYPDHAFHAAHAGQSFAQLYHPPMTLPTQAYYSDFHPSHAATGGATGSTTSLAESNMQPPPPPAPPLPYYAFATDQMDPNQIPSSGIHPPMILPPQFTGVATNVLTAPSGQQQHAAEVDTSPGTTPHHHGGSFSAAGYLPLSSGPPTTGLGHHHQDSGLGHHQQDSGLGHHQDGGMYYGSYHGGGGSGGGGGIDAFTASTAPSGGVNAYVWDSQIPTTATAKMAADTVAAWNDPQQWPTPGGAGAGAGGGGGDGQVGVEGEG